MEKLFHIIVIFSLSINLTACFLDDTSHVQAVSIETLNNPDISSAMDDEFGLVANQVIKNNGHFWAKDAVLPAENNTVSGEGVDIRDGMAIIANSFNNYVKIFGYDYELKTWHQEATIQEMQLGRFGESVYIDRKWAVVGAPNSDTVVIYTRIEDENGIQWQEYSRLTVEWDWVMEFGSSVDILDNTLFIAGYKADRVYIYELEDQQWQFKQLLDHRDDTLPTPKQFGWTLDAHGDLLAIGAYRDIPSEDSADRGGLVHIYQKQGNLWVFLQSLRPFSTEGPIIGKDFSHHLAINDKNILVGDNTLEKIFRYTKSNNLWVPTNIIEAPTDETSNNFGKYLAISDHYLLTGSPKQPVLMGPAVSTFSVSGKVIDPNGNTVTGATVSGMLANIQTNELGLFQADLPLGWYGNLTASSNGIDSEQLQISPIFHDTQLADILLNEVPMFSVWINYGKSQSIYFRVTGFDEPILARRILSLNLPNGWSGEIQPVSDAYRFTPEKLVIDSLSDNMNFAFTAELSQNPE